MGNFKFDTYTIQTLPRIYNAKKYCIVYALQTYTGIFTVHQKNWASKIIHLVHVMHLLVPVDVGRLEDLHQLQRHLQRDRDQIVVQDEEGDELPAKAVHHAVEPLAAHIHAVVLTVVF